MPNTWSLPQTVDGRWNVSYTADQASTQSIILNTSNKFLDKNILVQATIPQANISGGGNTINANVTGATGLLTEVENVPQSDPYITVTSTGTITVNTAGWISSSSSSGNTQVIYKITKGDYSAGEDSEAKVNGTITPSVGLNANATTTYGFTQTKPSGTNGTHYLTVDPNATVKNTWSVTPRATITTAGYISTGYKNSTTTITGSPTIENGTNYYIPIVSTTVNGGDLTPQSFVEEGLTLTLGAGTNTSNRNMANYRVGTKNTSTYPYFFEIVGSTPSVSGTTTVTRSAITYSNSAGVIEEHISTQAIAGTSVSPTVSVNATSGSTYFSLKAAAASINATIAAPSLSKITSNVSGKTQIFSGVDLVNSNPANSITTYYIAVKGTPGAVTQGTPSINTEGYLKQSSQITATVSSNPPTSTFYLPVPTATFAQDGAKVYCSNEGYVPQGDSSHPISTISNGTISAVSTDPGNGFTELDDDDGVVIAAGGWLKITAGYYQASKISLATLIGDDTHILPNVSGYSSVLRVGYTAYDDDGALLAGSLATYNGEYEYP